MDPLLIEQALGDVGGEMGANGDALLTGPLLHEFHNLLDRVVDMPSLQLRSPLLAKGQHVHHEVVNAVLVAFEDAPAFADQSIVLVVEAHLDQVAAPLHPLQNVLDVMAEHGDGLPHSGQPFGLHERLLEAVGLDGQSRLPTDGHQEFERLLIKSRPAGVTLGVDRGSRGVDIDHPHQFVPPPHRDAHRLANARLQDAGGLLEPAVMPGIGCADRDPATDHMLDNARRQRDALARIDPPSNSHHSRLNAVRLAVGHQHTAAIRPDCPQREVEDLLQHLVE